MAIKQRTAAPWNIHSIYNIDVLLLIFSHELYSAPDSDLMWSVLSVLPQQCCLSLMSSGVENLSQSYILCQLHFSASYISVLCVAPLAFYTGRSSYKSIEFWLIFSLNERLFCMLFANIALPGSTSSVQKQSKNRSIVLHLKFSLNKKNWRFWSLINSGKSSSHAKYCGQQFDSLNQGLSPVWHLTRALEEYSLVDYFLMTSHAVFPFLGVINWIRTLFFRRISKYSQSPKSV